MGLEGALGAVVDAYRGAQEARRSAKWGRGSGTRARSNGATRTGERAADLAGGVSVLDRDDRGVDSSDEDEGASDDHEGGHKVVELVADGRAALLALWGDEGTTVRQPGPQRSTRASERDVPSSRSCRSTWRRTAR